MGRVPLLVGTAGHVDHGKSALVRRLTGTDPDRTPEERARGISISLGYAVADLPGGGRVAFVDVPGHERFVRTMVAGAHALDVALLCVSCEDGVMPQTREHLDVLRLLEVPSLVVALTFADRVDAELVELVSAEVADLLAEGPYAGSTAVPFSAVTGQGEAAILAALAGRERSPRRTGDVPWLAVDRSFHRPGRGTVVTGSLWGGPMRRGASLWCWPGGGAVRVRGLEQHGVEVAAVEDGARAALNLAGVDGEAPGRGAVLAVASLPLGDCWDVWLEGRVAGQTLRDGESVRLLVGTADLAARVRLPAGGVDAAGEVPAQLRLDAPWPAIEGTRFVLRRPSPAATLAGGAVLDAEARPVRRREADAWRCGMYALRRGDPLARLARAGELGLPPGRAPDGATVLGDRAVAPAVARALLDRLRRHLEVHHAERPLSRGVPLAALRDRFRRLSSAALAALVDEAARRDILWQADGVVATREPRWCDRSRSARSRALAHARAAGLEGVREDALPIPAQVRADDLIARMIDAGELRRVPPLGVVDAAALEGLRQRLAQIIPAEGCTAGALRDALGLTRRTVIPLFEWCDTQGWTRREGDLRVLSAPR